MRLWCQRLKVQCDEPLSNVALYLNVRHYISAAVTSYTATVAHNVDYLTVTPMAPDTVGT
jgi:hypothetical protein